MITFKELIGYSIFTLPLITLISWALFKGFFKGDSKQRAGLVVIICTVVTLTLIGLAHYGGQRGPTFTNSDLVYLLDGVIAAAIGIKFWGRSRKDSAPIPRPKE